MSEPIRPFEPLTSENAAALDLIDHQVGLMTGSRLFNGELKHNVVALTPPFRGTAVSRLQRPDSHICDVYRRDRESPLHVGTGRPWPRDVPIAQMKQTGLSESGSRASRSRAS